MESDSTPESFIVSRRGQAEAMDWPDDGAKHLRWLEGGSTFAAVGFGSWLRLEGTGEWVKRGEHIQPGPKKPLLVAYRITALPLPPPVYDGRLKQPPVFVCGVGRSGTTLMTDLLGTHPALSPLYETEVVTQVAWKLYDWKADVMEVDASIRRIVQQWAKQLPMIPGEKAAYESFEHGPHYVNLDSREMDAITDTFLAAMRRGECNNPLQAFRDLFITPMFSKHLEKMDGSKSIIVNKTPSYANIIDMLGYLFPDAKFIHMVRDGRGVATSVLPLTWSHGPPTLDSAATWWEARLLNVTRWGLKHPDRIVHVRFEDLVTDPEKELMRVFDFLDMEAVPSRQATSQIIQRRDGCFYYGSEKKRRIHKDRADAWRKGTEEEVQKLHAAFRSRDGCHSALCHYGYAVEEQGESDSTATPGPDENRTLDKHIVECADTEPTRPWASLGA
jgi:hypothetical protein